MKINSIVDLLFKNQIINNKFAFKIWIRLNSYDKKLKYGEYIFDNEVTVYSVCEKLFQGDSIYRKITIVEGTSKYELFKYLKEIDPSSNLTINDIPYNIIADTYAYKFNDSASKILENIIFLSDKKFKTIWVNRKKNPFLNNKSDLFVLASLVEMETPKKSEKNLVAGVFFNRLKKNMRLQSDPTVAYSLTLGKKKLGRKLTRKDLRYKSEFNTYINKGLPPFPISFPGLDSLLGVINPHESDFLYFVANKVDGGHLFSSNYSEHLKNVNAMKNYEKKNK